MDSTEKIKNNHTLAEALELIELTAYAWDPAPECPQRHPNENHQAIGEICEECRKDWSYDHEGEYG